MISYPFLELIVAGDISFLERLAIEIPKGDMHLATCSCEKTLGSILKTGSAEFDSGGI